MKIKPILNFLLEKSYTNKFTYKQKSDMLRLLCYYYIITVRCQHKLNELRLEMYWLKGYLTTKNKIKYSMILIKIFRM